VALAIAVHLLGFTLAYLMAPPLPVKKVEPELTIFPMLPFHEDRVAPKPKPRASDARVKRSSGEAAPHTQQPPQEPPAAPLKMIMVSRDVFAAGDISRLPSHRDERTFAGTGTGADSDSGVGEGPDGAPLYNAEWYVEPTQAEMAYYLPKSVPRSGWGMVVCRTVPNYGVDDCRELEESPAGSGLARSVRQAAWQFRVRPPRIGGRPLVGAWVRIRFDVVVGFRK